MELKRFLIKSKALNQISGHLSLSVYEAGWKSDARTCLLNNTYVMNRLGGDRYKIYKLYELDKTIDVKNTYKNYKIIHRLISMCQIQASFPPKRVLRKFTPQEIKSVSAVFLLSSLFTWAALKTGLLHVCKYHRHLWLAFVSFIIVVGVSQFQYQGQFRDQFRPPADNFGVVAQKVI